MIPRYEPMLATQWPAAFDDDSWWFEPKWDGYRLIVTHDGSSTSLRTRRGNDVTQRYPELSAIRSDRPIVLDGEVVVLDDEGRPSFELLQQRSGRLGATAPTRIARLVAFDVLHVGGDSLVDQPLEERRQRLAELALPDVVQLSEGVRGDGRRLWETVLERDLEGVVAKRLGSRYRPGVRSEDWRKIHHIHTAKAVVGGFTRGDGGRARTFGGLLVGQWDGDRLRLVGSVGTGFSDADLVAIRSTLDQLSIDECPFHDDPLLPSDATWVEPALVAAIGYRNWTAAGRLRQPRFVGFTDDPVDAVTTTAEGPG